MRRSLWYSSTKILHAFLKDIPSLSTNSWVMVVNFVQNGLISENCGLIIMLLDPIVSFEK